MKETTTERPDAKRRLALLVNWQWWNERVIPVYEGNWHEWIAPRWYLVIVVAAYAVMIGIGVHGITQLAKLDLHC